MESDPVSPTDLSKLEHDLGLVPQPDVQGCAPRSSQLRQDLRELCHSISQLLCSVPPLQARLGWQSRAAPLPRQDTAPQTPPWCCWLSGTPFPQVRSCLGHPTDFGLPAVPRVSPRWLKDEDGLGSCCVSITASLEALVALAGWQGWLWVAEVALGATELLLLPFHPPLFPSQSSRSPSPWRAAPAAAAIPSSRKLPGRSCGLWRAMTEVSVPCSRYKPRASRLACSWSGARCAGVPKPAEELLQGRCRGLWRGLE